MKVWKKRSQDEIKDIVFKALEQNVNYHQQTILGLAASNLDDKVFNQGAWFTKDAPYISNVASISLNIRIKGTITDQKIAGYYNNVVKGAAQDTKEHAVEAIKEEINEYIDSAMEGPIAKAEEK